MENINYIQDFIYTHTHKHNSQKNLVESFFHFHLLIDY